MLTCVLGAHVMHCQIKDELVTMYDSSKAVVIGFNVQTQGFIKKKCITVLHT